MIHDEYGTKEAPVSLSGNLEVFPLEEVLRLLARSRQTGRLRVDGSGAGSVYLDEGAISYATQDPDETFRRMLLGSGVVTEESLNHLDVTKGVLSEAVAPGVTAGQLEELVREQCVESVYRIRRPQHGPFTFSVDVRPRYATGQRYDIESIVADSDRRAAEWADVEEVVADLSTPWRMVSEIADESVTVTDVAWRFLAALEGNASVDVVADRLGLTSFQAARRMAELARARLVEAVEVAAPAAPAVTAPTTYVSTVFEPETRFEAEPEPQVDQTEPEPAPVDKSWWEEEETPTFEPTPYGESEGYDVDPGEEQPREIAEGDDESFLEGVFGGIAEDEEAVSTSDLSAGPVSDDTSEEASEDDDDDQHGFGLLRRRGLGAAFRELADG